MIIHPAPSSRLRRLLLLPLLPVLAACGGGSGTGGGGPSIPVGPDVTPPSVRLLAPTTPRAPVPGDMLQVAFQANDDRAAEVQILLDRDGDVLTVADQIVLFTGTDQNGTPVALDLDTAAVPPARYELFARVDDGTHTTVWDRGPHVVVYPGLAGVSAPRANRYGVTGTHVAFSVGEAEQGNTILNGDGDAGDGVIFVLDVLTGTVTPTGLSVDVTSVGLQPTAQVLPSDTGAIAWHQREVDQGRVLNGDADIADTVVSFVAPNLGLPATTNPTGGAALTSVGMLERRVVQLDEVAHGFDLNGDGDVLDLVVRTLSYPTNTLLPAFGPQLRPGTSLVGTARGVGAYLADEATQGPGNTGQFLNTDPDTTDTLVVLVDLFAGTATVGRTNVDPTAALAVAPSGGLPLAAYYTDESLVSPPGSLNGDGDTADFVPTIHPGAPPERFPASPTPPLNAGLGARHVFVHGPLVVQLAAEEGHDTNLDTDGTDTEILWWADASLPAPVWTPIHPGLGTLNGLALDGGAAAMVWPGWLGLSVAEVSNGTVFNGDGDQSEQVYMLVDMNVNPPVVHNTGIVPLDPTTLPLPGATLATTGVGGDTGVVVQAAETANGDLNGDGDAVDTVLVYFDWSAPTTPVVLGDTGGLHAAVRGGVLAVTAYEALTQKDHNGDGDTQDLVFRTFDRAGNAVLPGVLCDQHSVPATDDGTVWAFLRSEIAEQRDLNGDGDASDLVLGVWLP